MSLKKLVSEVRDVMHEFEGDYLTSSVYLHLVFLVVQTEPATLRWGRTRKELAPGCAAVTLEDLARRFKTSKTNLWNRLRYLEESGFIEVERGAGRRIANVIKIVHWNEFEIASSDLPRQNVQKMRSGASGGATVLSDEANTVQSRSLNTLCTSQDTEIIDETEASADVQYTGFIRFSYCLAS